MTTAETPQSNKKPWYKKWWVWVIAAVLILFGVVNSSNSSDESSTEAESTTSSAPSSTSVEETASEVASSEQSMETVAESTQVMPWTRHEMCEPDDGTSALLAGALTDQTLTIANAQLIKDGSDTWIGASLVRPDGDFESRSDVWLLRDGALFSVSGGAKNNSIAVSSPNASDSMANEYAAGVDRCVVAETMGR